MKKQFFYIVGLSILLISLAACGNEDPTPFPPTAVLEDTAVPEDTAAAVSEPITKPTEVSTAEPTEVPTEVPTQEPTVEPTAAPTVEPTEEPVADEAVDVVSDLFTADQISLDTDALGVDWFYNIMPAVPYDANQSPGSNGLPQHVAITFGIDDPVERPFGDPIMYIIPVNAYMQMWDDAGDNSVSNMVGSIAGMAAELPNPAPTSGMPILPSKETIGFNDIAVQVGKTAVVPASATQEGYRFVGRFGQSPNPVTNRDLRYIYQGFTTDGEYLVSFFYPVRTDALPDDVNEEVMNIFETDATAHMNDSIIMLNKLEVSDWDPNLAALDAVIASLQIEGMGNAISPDKTLSDSLPAEITTETWQWISFSDSMSGTQSIPEPERYQLTLNKDGTVNVQADCNTAAGQYDVEGSNINFTMGPITLAACPPDSLANEFMQALGAATIYFAQDGDLFFDLIYDSGTMRLTAVANTISNSDSDETSDNNKPGGSEITPESISMDTQGLANNWTWQVIDGSSASEEADGAPAITSYILLTFDDITADINTVTANDVPHIAIFPVESYIAAGGERVEDEVVRLQALIDGAAVEDPMPLLPPPSNFMGRWAQFANIGFTEGNGVRYVSETVNRQGIGAWVNEGMAYYYQGLTDDGRFYISLVWPVRTDSLPNTYNDVPEDTTNAASESNESYEAYLIEMQNMLNTLPGSAWEPNLADIDGMVQSLQLYK